jgi:acetolactate synthase-1/2/3 large subunit
VACAWIDSIPLLVISGQSYSTQTIGKSGLRQLGVQEINIVDMVRPITKYAVMIEDPRTIRYHLDKALHLAASGRPGPVWLDIPINLQLTLVEEDELEPFAVPEEKNLYPSLKSDVVKTIELIRQAKRPMILLGNGVRLSHAVEEFFRLADRLAIPIVTSRNANDLIEDNHPLYSGRVGSFGQRAANLAVQNSDLLISLGSRVNLAVTGWAHRDFAREAKKVVVDIDPAELTKSTIHPDLAICCDAREFILEMIREWGDSPSSGFGEWKEIIRRWKGKYPVVLPEYAQTADSVNTYYFLDKLSDALAEDDVVVTDMGMSFQCTMQALRLKKGQKLFTASGLAPMGYGLPGAIGACFGRGGGRVVCISGDGGLQMNVQEFQTVYHYQLPIKLFVFNNNGYTSMRETQRAYFEGYIAAEAGSGVSMPDFVRVAEGYRIPAVRVHSQDGLEEVIQNVLATEGPILCDIKVSENQLVIPKQGAFDRPDGKTVPRPIEDMIPYQDREDFDREMIIEPIPFDPYKGEA